MQEGSRFESWLGPFFVEFECVGFLSQFENMHVRLLCDFKLTVGLNVYVRLILCLFVDHVMDCPGYNLSLA